MGQAMERTIDKQALGEIWKMVMRRFGDDQCLRIAASLSYTSLLSLVPLMTISFAIFAAFPAFEGVQQQLQAYVFENFVPAAGDAVSGYLETFTEKTGGMTTIGIVGLGVTAIMLLATIEDALNRIFRVREKRPFVSRLLMFWALLTLGPLLMGASLSLSTYFYALTNWVNVDGLGVGGVSVSGFASVVLPNVMIMMGLTFFYMLVPNRTITWKNALIGGISAGFLFGVLKKLFGLYISHFPSYTAIYGVLATIPIFLIWMYLTWAVVLLGALLTATLGDWGQTAFREGKLVTPADKMSAALHALRLLKEQHGIGGALADGILTRELGSHVAVEVMKNLDKAGFVAMSGEDKWVLARDLAKTDLAELHHILGLDLADADYDHGKVAKVITEIEAVRIHAMKKSLSDVVV